MSVPYNRGPVTDAHIAVLRAEFGATKVYDTVVPGTATLPYLLVQVIDGGETQGPWADPEATYSIVHQVDCVGRMRSEAQWLQEKAFHLLTDRTAGNFDTPIEIPAGRVVADRLLDAGALGGVTPQGTPAQYLYVTQDRYTSWITPSEL